MLKDIRRDGANIRPSHSTKGTLFCRIVVGAIIYFRLKPVAGGGVKAKDVKTTTDENVKAATLFRRFKKALTKDKIRTVSGT